MTQDSAPFIKYFLFLFYRQMPSPLRRRNGHHTSLSIRKFLRCHRNLLCIRWLFWCSDHRVGLVSTSSTLSIDWLMLSFLCYWLNFIYWTPLRGPMRELYRFISLYGCKRLLRILRSRFLRIIISTKKGSSGLIIVTSCYYLWRTFLCWLRLAELADNFRTWLAYFCNIIVLHIYLR